MRSQTKHFKTYAQERITMALLYLMMNNRFDDITVLEITQRAGVSRRTFYLYFKTKTDVLNCYYDVLAKTYYESIPEDARSDYKAQALLFFSFWEQRRTYLDALRRNDLTHVLFGEFEKYLLLMSETNASEGIRSYYSSFFAGGLWALLLAWSRNGYKESPAELAEVASKFEPLDMFNQFPD